MALTDSIAAYDYCFQAFERAAKSKKGIRILFEDKKTANYFRLRMNYARVLQRREAVRMYERTDPRFGKSEFVKFRAHWDDLLVGDLPSGINDHLLLFGEKIIHKYSP